MKCGFNNFFFTLKIFQDNALKVTNLNTFIVGFIQMSQHNTKFILSSSV